MLALIKEMYYHHKHEFDKHIRTLVVLFGVTEITLLIFITTQAVIMFKSVCLGSELNLDELYEGICRNLSPTGYL